MAQKNNARTKPTPTGDPAPKRVVHRQPPSDLVLADRLHRELAAIQHRAAEHERKAAELRQEITDSLASTSPGVRGILEMIEARGQTPDFGDAPAEIG